ncbi:TolC family protein [Cupriavidus necator]|uniref:TolC family protein n=1 Tax=Cupriavidus necator TaxID=106590 RepID=UPI003ECF8EFC
MDEAFSLAEQRGSVLQAKQAATTTVQGELQEARASLWHNPQLGGEYRWRQLSQAGAPSAKKQDAALGIAQTFETGGQQSARRGAAEANSDGLVAAIEQTRRDLRAEVERQFVQIQALQLRVQMERESLELLQRAASLVRRRVQAGEDSRLDGNLARVEAERGSNQLARAQEDLSQARSTLAVLLQWDRPALPEAVGELDRPQPGYTLDGLMSVAAGQSRLQALEAQERGADYRLKLERGMTHPDVTVGLNYSPEKGIDGRDRITTLAISVPLPLFRRNQAGIGRASTELTQSRIEREAARREIQTAVPTLWQRLQSLRTRVDRLRGDVVPALDENQTLSLKALREGEIGLTQFLLVRRQVLDGQRDLLDARTELRLTQSSLEHSAGWPAQLPAASPDQPR